MLVPWRDGRVGVSRSVTLYLIMCRVRTWTGKGVHFLDICTLQRKEENFLSLETQSCRHAADFASPDDISVSSEYSGTVLYIIGTSGQHALSV